MVVEPKALFNRMPVEGPIVGRFGDWYKRVNGVVVSTTSDDPAREWQHRGIDQAVVRVPVVSPVSVACTVVAPFNDGSFGRAVCLAHPDGWFSLYAHLESYSVVPGDTVQPGQQIGISGNTGGVPYHHHWQLCDSPTFPVDISHSRDPLQYFIHQEEDDQPLTPAERGLLNIAWGDFGRALEAYRALRQPDVAQNIRDLLPDEGIETAFANNDQSDDLNAAMVMRGRLTTLATADNAEAIYKILGG